MRGRAVALAFALYAGASSAQPARVGGAVSTATLGDGLTVWMAPRAESPEVYATAACARAGDEDARLPVGVAALSAFVLGRFVTERCDVEPGVAIDHGEAQLRWRGAPATVACGVRALAVMAQTGALRDDWFEAGRVVAATQWSRLVQRERLDRDAAAWTFGGGHPLARRMFPAEAEVRSLTGASVRWFLRDRYDPGRCGVAVVGAFEPQAMTAALERAVDGWAPRRLDARTPLTTQTPPHPVRTLLYDLPTRELAELRLLIPLPPQRRDDAVDGVLEALLGAGPHSRLNRVVREARGVSYGLHTRRRHDREQQWIELSGAVLIGSVGDTLAALATELSRLRTAGPTERELFEARARRSAALRDVWDDDGDLATLLASELAAGQPAPRLDASLAAIDAVTAADVRRRMADTPPWSDLTVAVYGPAAAIGPQLTTELVQPVRVR